jgi:YspA, cpYpsA-related SLOG family
VRFAALGVALDRGAAVRIIVCGSREWRDYERVREVLDALLAQRGPFTLVHGACPTGGDSIARAWGVGVVPLEAHPADWKGLGNGAGPARNEGMAAAGADLLLAFWDGRSKGTRDMIRRAVAHGIPVRIVAPVDPVLALGPEVY